MKNMFNLFSLVFPMVIYTTICADEAILIHTPLTDVSNIKSELGMRSGTKFEDYVNVEWVNMAKDKLERFTIKSNIHAIVATTIMTGINRIEIIYKKEDFKKNYKSGLLGSNKIILNTIEMDPGQILDEFKHERTDYMLNLVRDSHDEVVKLQKDYLELFDTEDWDALDKQIDQWRSEGRDGKVAPVNRMARIIVTTMNIPVIHYRNRIK